MWIFLEQHLIGKNTSLHCPEYYYPACLIYVRDWPNTLTHVTFVESVVKNNIQPCKFALRIKLCDILKQLAYYLVFRCVIEYLPPDLWQKFDLHVISKAK